MSGLFKNQTFTMTLDQVRIPFLVEQTYPIIVPSYAGWFDMSKIHDIERRSNPEFFNGKSPLKTPSIYKDYRDFMINSYRLEPNEYLTVTACRRNLVGDVCAIIRVHAFLEQWGLINYQIDPETRPAFRLPPISGHVQAVSNTPIVTQEMLAQHPPPSTVGGSSSQEFVKLEEKHYSPSLNAMEQTSPKEEDEKSDKVPRVDKVCFTCGVNCSQTWYHNLKNKKYDICPNCYKQGRFSSSFNSSDFLCMDAIDFNHDEEKPWSNQETLLLLEAIETYGDDWNQIALHVGSRTKEQCLIHFLQIPIEDPYRQKLQGDFSPFKKGFLPFDENENPVLSTLTYLASIVQQGMKERKQNESVKQGETSFGNSEFKNPLERVAYYALKSAAQKAKLIAAFENRQLRRLVFSLIQAQLEKLQLKMKVLEQLEKMCSLELSELDLRGKNLLLSRLSTKKMLLAFNKKLEEAVNLGGEDGLKIIDDLMSTEHAEALLTFEMPTATTVSPLSKQYPDKFRTIAL